MLNRRELFGALAGTAALVAVGAKASASKTSLSGDWEPTTVYVTHDPETNTYKVTGFRRVRQHEGYGVGVRVEDKRQIEAVKAGVEGMLSIPKPWMRRYPAQDVYFVPLEFALAHGTLRTEKE